jgi:uncharacterized protein YecT (DUF1311 family)
MSACTTSIACRPVRLAGMALLAIAACWALSARAGAYEDCVTAGNQNAVMSCLAGEEKQANAELSSAEAQVAQKARAVESATGKPGIHAALAKSVRDFAAYRTSHCAYVREMAVREPVAEQAAVACRVDLTRRRTRDLRP